MCTTSTRRSYLKEQGLSRGRYNQIANFVLAQSEINIAIGDKPPKQYFGELAEQVNGGKKSTAASLTGTNYVPISWRTAFPHRCSKGKFQIMTLSSKNAASSWP